MQTQFSFETHLFQGLYTKQKKTKFASIFHVQGRILLSFFRFVCYLLFMYFWFMVFLGGGLFERLNQFV